MPAKSFAQRLLEMPPTASNRLVAEVAAARLIEATDTPFRFAINHDIRPPKNAPCPVEYDWTRKDQCGIEWKLREPTRKWLTKALLSGYRVTLMSRTREPMSLALSIEIIRRRAVYHQAPKVDTDDDIPF